MIEFQQGNLFEADVEALVNAVNCVGIMGRGIALQFRQKFPENYAAYKAICIRGEFKPGKMFVFDMHNSQYPQYIINFLTKRHWKAKSQIEDIQIGLAAMINTLKQQNVASVAIPPLGCGLGGLSWDTVKPLIVDAVQALPNVRSVIYEPAEPPASERP